eukprot:TRINITY_DN1804_c0_g5_i1.p1 TRINITY_DN1804_c0_g5~~TRINITY_DN1804_c0_g5_i1.p1  ORF type:complete len:123 (-),score=23.99 TRINITY_DN1804_c0_g5_i1:188-556(-)
MEPNPKSIKTKLIQTASKTSCCDCGTSSSNCEDKPNPSYVSMNNGVFLCDLCAEKHKAFGENYSFVRSIADYDWSYDCYLYMDLGANENFKAFMTKYALMEEPPENRYRALAAEYYRMKVLL